MAAGIVVACGPDEHGAQGDDWDDEGAPMNDGGSENVEGDAQMPSTPLDSGAPFEVDEHLDAGGASDAGTGPDADTGPDAGPPLPTRDSGAPTQDAGPDPEWATFPAGALPDLSAGCVGVRYAQSSDRIYVEGTGSVCSPRDIALSLEKLKTPVPAGRGLIAVDAFKGIYYLASNLFVRNGAKLDVRGIAVGGDTNQLRMKSLNSAEPGSFVYIRAEYGDINFEGTRVTSWDDAVGGPDLEYELLGRAFIHVRSSLDSDGVTPHESRMDVIDSEISYLGYYAAEAYGLVWKVSGAHTTGSGQSLFDLVNVYGDIRNSNIHHNYFGVYTYGAFGVTWDGNEVHHNIQYGLDPHDDSDTLTITNNNVYNNGNHGIICSRRCDNLRIANNLTRANGGVGIFLHGFVTDSVVEDNEALDNLDAGIALFDSHRNTIRRNILLRNQYGVRLSVGSSSNTFEENELGFSTKYGIYFYKGTDIPVQGDGRPKLNVFTKNHVHDGAQALKMSDADSNTFRQNSFGMFANRQVTVTDGRDNVFDENAFLVEDDDLIPIFRIQGSAQVPTVLTISRPGPMILNVLGQGTGVIKSAEGQVYSSLFPVGMGIDAEGSELTVANTGEADMRGEVRPLSLFVVPSAAGHSASVKQGVWAQNRSWTVTSVQASSLAYRLGELLEGNCYAIRREGSHLTTLVADALGFVSFTDTSRANDTTSYVLSPADCP